MGSYERYIPPSETRSPSVWLGWAALLVVGIGVAGWLLISDRSREAGPGELVEASGATPTDSAASPSEPVAMPRTGATAGLEPSPYAKDARIAELEMQLRDKDFELSKQRSEIESLEARVGQLQEDSERYRAGLDQAVAELNQLRSEIGRLEGTSGSARTGSVRPQQSPGVQPVGPPYVTISPMGFVTVSGYVSNPTRHASRGKLEVSLVGSGGVIETRDFPMYIPPNKQERYDITFPGIFPTERIAAQARWVE